VLESSEGHGAWEFSFRGFDLSGSAATSASELFSRFLGRKNLRRDPERGQDIEYSMSIGFAESIRGARSRISVQRRHSCTACNGMGRLAGDRGNSCEACHGSGKVLRPRGRLHFRVACEICAGTGRVDAACPECGGDSRNTRLDVLDVDIPPGAASGSRIRFAGKGDAGRFGGAPGDLYVTLNVASHPFFTRAGDNIQCTLPLTFSEAALGAKVEVPTLDGNATLRIPPATQNGQVFRIRGRGAPSLVRPGLRGDQFVKVTIGVPRVADERSRQILRELAQLNPENPRKDIAGL
jgi:molecular chaperone DnaJ